MDNRQSSEGNLLTEMAKWSISGGFGCRRAKSVPFPAFSGWGILSPLRAVFPLEPLLVCLVLRSMVLGGGILLILQRKKQTHRG